MSTNALAARSRAGDARAAARLMRDLAERRPSTEAVQRERFPRTDPAKGLAAHLGASREEGR